MDGTGDNTTTAQVSHNGRRMIAWVKRWNKLPHPPSAVNTDNRAISTICIHIVSKQPGSSRNVCIYIQEPSPSRIIVSALQVVQPRLGIVIIPTVTEGVIRPNDVLFQRGSSRNNGYGAVTPSVVGIGPDLVSIGVINGNNVALEVLLKVEGIKDISGVALGSVLQPDGRSAFVIEVGSAGNCPRLR